MKGEKTVVEAVKHAHRYGGDGSAWRLYAPNSKAWYRQREYDSAHTEWYIMASKAMRITTMYISTIEN